MEAIHVWIEYGRVPSHLGTLWMCLISLNFPIFPDIQAILAGIERDPAYVKMTLNESKML